jgi:hypothetical protein
MKNNKFKKLSQFMFLNQLKENIQRETRWKKNNNNKVLMKLLKKSENKEKLKLNL